VEEEGIPESMEFLPQTWWRNSVELLPMNNSSGFSSEKLLPIHKRDLRKEMVSFGWRDSLKGAISWVAATVEREGAQREMI
jgi:hypothetical protein